MTTASLFSSKPICFISDNLSRWFHVVDLHAAQIHCCQAPPNLHAVEWRVGRARELVGVGDPRGLRGIEDQDVGVAPGHKRALALAEPEALCRMRRTHAH